MRRDYLSEAARSGLGFCSVMRCLIYPDFMYWWGLFWVLVTFGSDGVHYNKNSSVFRLLKLWSADVCLIACCVHHSVFRFTVAERASNDWDTPISPLNTYKPLLALRLV